MLETFQKIFLPPLSLAFLIFMLVHNTGYFSSIIDNRITLEFLQLVTFLCFLASIWVNHFICVSVRLYEHVGKKHTTSFSSLYDSMVIAITVLGFVCLGYAMVSEFIMVIDYELYSRSLFFIAMIINFIVYRWRFKNNYVPILATSVIAFFILFVTTM